MEVRTRVLWLPKDGHGAHEYEDAAALSPAAARPVRAAVTDGATESAFARPWARALADGFVEDGAETREDLAARLPAWRARWRGAVAPRLADLPWYAAAKAEEGAFAAFLGLTLHPDGTWRALSVGDACLFHLHDGGAESWPFTTPDAFTHRPALLATRPSADAPPVETRAGAWAPGDVFLLATDALAAWLLGGGDERIRAAASFDEAAFAEAVASARADRALRNDDVTLVMVEIR